ncbi:MAG: ribosome maturation factor RimM [Actinobacteria bacterium]|nr:ribosome maturation factor RimM [Actinomycetota bacterium]
MSEKVSIARLIGVIGKPRGLKGELYVRFLTGYPNTFRSGDLIYLDEDCVKEIIIENVIELNNKSRTLLKFFNYNNRNEAEKLRGCLLYRKEKDKPEIGENNYWVDDIIGCLIYAPDKNIIGKVKNVENFPSNDSLIVELENMDTDIKSTGKSKKNRDTIIIPMIEDFILDIDIKNKKIILKKVPEYI